jgi:hypothetical protein
VTSIYCARIHYTLNSGTFLIIRGWFNEGIYDEIGDVVFRFHVNEVDFLKVQLRLSI